MRQSRQAELLDRLVDVDHSRPWSLGAASMRNAAASYTDPARFRGELEVLLPFGTVQYVLVPNGLLVYERDHLEVWRICARRSTRGCCRSDLQIAICRKNRELSEESRSGDRFHGTTARESGCSGRD